MDHITTATDSIKRDEGLRLKMYKCTEGFNTIGYGFNLDACEITTEIADLLLDIKLGEAVQDCATYSYWHALSEDRKAALINMRYCLGPGRFRGFRKMHGALVLRDYERAAAEMLDSRFAEQVGQRAVRLADAMRRG